MSETLSLATLHLLFFAVIWVVRIRASVSCLSCARVCSIFTRGLEATALSLEVYTESSRALGAAASAALVLVVSASHFSRG